MQDSDKFTCFYLKVKEKVCIYKPLEVGLTKENSCYKYHLEQIVWKFYHTE